MLNSNFQALRSPCRWQSIDESIVALRLVFKCLSYMILMCDLMYTGHFMNYSVSQVHCYVM